MKSKYSLNHIVYKMLIIAVFSSLLISCKKEYPTDYPNDIPDWLKEHIRETKKYDNYYSTYSRVGFKFEEWERDGVKIYEYFYGGENPRTTFYDYDGNEMYSGIWFILCTSGSGPAEIIECSHGPYGFDIVGYKYSRFIFNSGDYARYQ